MRFLLPLAALAAGLLFSPGVQADLDLHEIEVSCDLEEVALDEGQRWEQVGLPMRRCGKSRSSGLRTAEWSRTSRQSPSST